jgi:protein ImuB
MFRYLVAWLPTFRLERCGWSADQRVVLVEEDRSALRVQCATAPALDAGVRPGMTLAEACALSPELLVERRVAEEETADLAELADQLLRISPAVAPLPPSGLVAEVGRGDGVGAGQERALVERIRHRLAALGHPARVVIADDPDTARILAAFGQADRVVAARDGAAALAPLPIDALALPEREHTLLTSLGVHTIGAFAALDAAAVVGRLGPVGVTAHALAQGRGRRPVLTPWTDDATLALTQELPDPVVQLEALLFIVNALLRDACARLRPQARAATRVVLHFRLDGGGQQHLSMRLGQPTRDPAAILGLLRSRLERVQLASPVDALTLELPDAAPFDGRQHDLLQRHRAAEAVADVAARLQDTLGGSAVLCPRLSDRHRPEAEWAAAPLQIDALARPTPVPWADVAPASRAVPGHAPVDDPVDEWRGRPDEPPPDRPPLLLCPAQSTQVRTGAGGRPARVEVDGRWLDATHATGPERLCGEWWDRPFQRDYWRVDLQDGRRAWLYREDGHWLLHGWWDRT